MNKLFDRVKKIPNIEYIILAIILLISIGVRLYKIDSPLADWHSWRQTDTAAVTRIYLKEGIDVLKPKYYDISSVQTGIFNPRGLRLVEFPLYNLVHAFLVSKIGVFSFEVWGRLVSVIAAGFSTLLIFVLGRRFINTEGGLLAAFFYAAMPYNIYFTRVILPEPLATTLGLLSLVLFIKYLDKEKYLLLVSSTLVLALAMLVKPFIFFYSVPMVYLALQKKSFKEWVSDLRLVFAASLAVVPFFAWRAWINNFPVGIPHFSWAFNGDGIRFKPSFWRWIFAERIGNMMLGIWGVFPFVYGLLKTKKGQAFNAFFFLGMVLYMSVFATANVRHDYYQTIIVPAIVLILAQGSLVLWQAKDMNKRLSRLLLLFSLLVMFITTATHIKGFYQINHPEIIEAGERVDKLVAEDAWVIAPYNGDAAFLYHTNRRGWPVIELPLEELIDKGASILVSVNFDDATNEVMETYEIIEKTDTYVIADLTKPL